MGQMQTLQRELSRFEHTYQLGDRVNRYWEGAPIMTMNTAIWFLILPLVSLPFVVIWLFTEAPRLDSLLLFFSSPAALLLWTVCSAVINFDRHKVEARYANGYARVTCKGKRILSASLTHWDDTSISSITYNRARKVSKNAVFRWEDVGFIEHSVGATQLESSSFPDYQHHYRLRRHDSTRIKGWTAWAKLFEEKSLPFLLSQARTAYQSGQSLSFGVLGLSQEGIYYRDRLLAWDDLRSLNFDETTGAITLESVPQPGNGLYYHRPWASIPVGRVPNFSVFSHLVREISSSFCP